MEDNMSRNMTKLLISQGVIIGLAVAYYIPLCIAGARVAKA